MKIRLNKKTLAAMPAPIRLLVEDWQRQWRKAFISLNAVDKFYVDEDAKITAFSPDLSTSKTVRAAGEFAGFTELMPGQHCPLPPGCTAVASGFFCGHPWLTIYHNPAGVDPLAMNGFNPQRLTA